MSLKTDLSSPFFFFFPPPSPALDRRIFSISFPPPFPFFCCDMGGRQYDYSFFFPFLLSRTFLIFFLPPNTPSKHARREEKEKETQSHSFFFQASSIIGRLWGGEDVEEGVATGDAGPGARRCCLLGLGEGRSLVWRAASGGDRAGRGAAKAG